ncbi:MAG: hypothetical protein EPO09_12330 [Aquabacterium sp.]|uniref:hypothetical protein n=1 Tax=Aquabacterium sp. TaxID=1872578 RepID=UPI001200445A|nr:hypothetical protein [Aquabacterium sp.]TAK93539.1 MAG: hypothetical protein EPO09_12330 [Aquabacterium sp.]
MHELERYRKVRHVAAAVALLALSACGGGGGSSTDAQAQPSSTKATVSGVAAKGLLRHALVTAYLPDAKGQPGQKLAEVVSDSSGHYTLTGLPVGRAILVVASRNTDPASPTTMADEATDQDVPVPTGFELSAATVLGGNGLSDNLLQITPYSTMAVDKARQSVATAGQFDATAVGKANADIRRYVGFDVLGDAPVFDETGHTPGNAAALALASVSTLAKSQSVETCPSLAGLTDAKAITAVKTQCQVDSLRKAGTSDDAVRAKLDEARLATASQEAYVGPLPPAPALQTVALKDVPVGDIDATKALTAYLRSDVPFIVGSTGDTLNTRVQQVQKDLSAAINPLDSANVRLLDAIVHAANLYAQREYGAPTSSTRFDGQGRQIGCTFYTDKTYAIEATVPSQRETQVCRVSYAYKLKTPATPDSPAVYSALQHAIFMEPGDFSDAAGGGFADFKFRTSLLWQDGSFAPNGSFEPDWQHGQRVMLAAGGGTEPFTSTLVATVRGQWVVDASGSDYITRLSITGDLAPAYERVQNVIQAKGIKTMADLVLAPDAKANQLSKLGITGGFSAVAADGSVSSIKLLDGSAIQGWLTLPDFSDAQLLAKSDDLSVHLVLQAATASGSVIRGSLDLSHFTDTALAAGSGLTTSERIAQQLNMPAQMSFSGVLASGGQNVFSGALAVTMEGLSTYDVTQPIENSAVTITLKINATVQVPSRPDLALKDLTLVQKSHAVAISGQLEQGSLWVHADGKQDANGVMKLNLLSDSGVSLAIDSSSATGRFSLMRGGNEVGLLDSHAGQISYADGSYERW